MENPRFKFGTETRSTIKFKAFDDLDTAMEAAGLNFDYYHKHDVERTLEFAREAGPPFLVTEGDRDADHYHLRPKVLFVFTVPGEGIRLLNELTMIGVMDNAPFVEVAIDLAAGELHLSKHGLKRDRTARRLIAEAGAIVTRAL